MVNIKSFELLQTVYKGLQGQRNQGLFIIRFFVAAGCSRYHLPEKGKEPLSTELEGPRHYIKERSLTDIKNSFPHPIKKKEAAEYLLTSFDTVKVRSIMNTFGIPSDIPENNLAFAYAIVEQFNAFVESDSEDLECDVSAEFLKYSAMTAEEVNKAGEQHGTLINGDSVYMAPYRNTSIHLVGCHEKFTHVWEIENSGRIIWSGRKLVFVNQSEIRPRAMTQVIEIPETQPHKLVRLEVGFDARGFEGEYEAKWEMQDSEGRNCFATTPRIFNFTIKTQYRKNTEETK